ncbi:MAG TPA: DUF177 domain-containing protein [Pyrinomonadaceae bacterium]|nr:DUF177 domain-containing protein [Pyrinomonadaceae bacterium]
MRIELDKLEGKSAQFAHTYGADELVLDDEHARLTEPPQVTGRINRSGHEVRLRGQITARAEVDCDRCLKQVTVPVEADFDVTYVPASDYVEQQGAAELQEEDLGVSVYENETIDVDELVREQVLLAIPARALCTEDCKGLCPVCGANRNEAACECESQETDPRWAALKNLTE